MSSFEDREKNFEKKFAHDQELQFIVPNRSFELYDLIGNFLGVLVAYFLVKIYLLFNRS